MDKARLIVLLKSKAFWGAVFAALAWLFAQPHVGMIEMIQAGGTILSAAGIRDAITKHGAIDVS